ncbi:MAG: acetylxylan esterase [Cyclobacteriaceae bacterium]|nr:acetylxylan esterase [Cyclobacteriaceae bacterium SS2]
MHNRWKYFNHQPDNLYNHFAEKAFGFLEQRAEEIADISTLDGWKERQASVKEKLHKLVGPFPDKTPLNAQVLRTVQKDGYRIEYIVFESVPDFHITSAMFIPDGLEQKAPTILFVNGHTDIAFRDELYQQVIINLVKKGFVVYTYDPTGQGERLQYFDEGTGKSKIGGSVQEHFHVGNQAFILGGSFAKYVIWDGIRAIDFLVSREEVDATRLGVAGHSGGGTQTAYISAFDNRVQAAAPSNYITSHKRLIQSIGLQDAEQNFYQGILHGIDHGDLLAVRAPRPALVMATSRDFFSIQGARETVQEVSRIYQANDRSSDFGFVEDNDNHTYTRKNREALYAFFQKHLDNPGDASDMEVEFLTGTDLQVTKTGQISTDYDGKNVFDLIAEETAYQINVSKKISHHDTKSLQAIVETSKKISGYQEPESNLDPVYSGGRQHNGYTLENHFIKGVGDYVIPFLLYRPEKATGKAIIYLDPQRKTSSVATGGELEKLVMQGNMVLVPDMIGYGEMGLNNKLTNTLWYLTMSVGESLTGTWTSDLTRLTLFLKEHEQITEITGIAHKELSPVLLHAAAYDSSISTVILSEPYISYRSIVASEYYNHDFYLSAVPGAIKHYDLPDLAASLAPRKLMIIGPTEGAGGYLSSETTNSELAVVQNHYKKSDALENLRIVSGQQPDGHRLIQEWVR